jgi:uncharacterized protein (TIGR02996 family)
VIGLYRRAEVLAFLHAAKECPEDDHPRLALADWFEERDDAERAEFIRLQCHLASASAIALLPQEHTQASDRIEALLNRFGGAWLGSLWRDEGMWHRGLLTVNLNRHADADTLADVLPWIDSMQFEITGREAFHQAALLLKYAEVNHVCFALRRPFREDNLLELLRSVQASPLLRTLPIGRHLTHLGSGLALTANHLECLRNAGVVPIIRLTAFWNRTLPLRFPRLTVLLFSHEVPPI